MSELRKMADRVIKRGSKMGDYHRIPVVWGIDRKYLLQAFVVMRSLLTHSKEIYHFFILTADNMEDEIGVYTNILKTEYHNFEVSVRMVDMGSFVNARIYNEHLSKAAYFRLLIPELILEYNKCIYLDCDVLVHGDLKELYTIEMGDDYLAGVKDCHIISSDPYQMEHQKILGLPSRDKYINSGVLVMNLTKMREDNLMQKFRIQLEKENWYEDQDVLNVCCYPYIKILPLQYNLFHFYLGNEIELLYDLPYRKEEFEFDHAFPFILHMGGKYKPWLNEEYKGGNEWWQLAEIFKESEDYRSYQQRCQKIKDENKMRNIIMRASKAKNVVVWGYYKPGMKLCDILLEYQLNNIVAIVDNNQAEWGKTYYGIPVMGLSSILKAYADIFWVIACQVSYNEVMEQLVDVGIDRNDMVHYIDKTRCYEGMHLLALREDACEKRVAKLAGRKFEKLQ